MTPFDTIALSVIALLGVIAIVHEIMKRVQRRPYVVRLLALVHDGPPVVVRSQRATAKETVALTARWCNEVAAHPDYDRYMINVTNEGVRQ